MAEVKKEEEKKVEKQVEAKKQTGESWLSRVPITFIIGGVVLIFIRYLMLSSAKKPLSELYLWAGAVVIVWYLIGRRVVTSKSSILTVEEAFACVKKEELRLRKEDIIKPFTKVYYTFSTGLQFAKGLTEYYIFGVKIVNDYKTEYSIAKCWASGEKQSIAYFAKSDWDVKGDEALNKVVLIPQELKQFREQGFSPDKWLFGGAGR